MNVLVTGGTKGLGRAIIDLFFDNGAHIAVCARGKEELNQLKVNFAQIDPNRHILTQVCDVSQKNEIEEIARFEKRSFAISSENQLSRTARPDQRDSRLQGGSFQPSARRQSDALDSPVEVPRHRVAGQGLGDHAGRRDQ